FVFGFVFLDMGLGGAAQRQQTDKSYAARVNGETITYGAYNRALYYLEQNYQQMYGGKFTPELAEAIGLNRQALDSPVAQRLLLQEAERLKLNASPEEGCRRIPEIP